MLEGGAQVGTSVPVLEIIVILELPESVFALYEEEVESRVTEVSL
jgi:hypothetical protein